MICILGTRRSGKTTALIKAAEATSLPIITPNYQMCMQVRMMAMRMGADVEVQPRQVRGYRFNPNHCISIDEAQSILEETLGANVSVAVFDADKFDFSNMSLLDMLAIWIRSKRVKLLGKEKP